MSPLPAVHMSIAAIIPLSQRHAMRRILVCALALLGVGMRYLILPQHLDATAGRPRAQLFVERSKRKVAAECELQVSCIVHLTFVGELHRLTPSASFRMRICRDL